MYFLKTCTVAVVALLTLPVQPLALFPTVAWLGAEPLPSLPARATGPRAGCPAEPLLPRPVLRALVQVAALLLDTWVALAPGSLTSPVSTAASNSGIVRANAFLAAFAPDRPWAKPHTVWAEARHHLAGSLLHCTARQGGAGLQAVLPLPAESPPGMAWRGLPTPQAVLAAGVPLGPQAPRRGGRAVLHQTLVPGAGACLCQWSEERALTAAADSGSALPAPVLLPMALIVTHAAL